jgi:hypothetical protein
MQLESALVFDRVILCFVFVLSQVPKSGPGAPGSLRKKACFQAESPKNIPQGLKPTLISRRLRHD